MQQAVRLSHNMAMHYSLQINTNGILLLLNKMVGVRETLHYFQNDPFPIEGHVFIAPFYGDIDTRSKGIVWYSKTGITDSDLLKKAEDHVQLTEYKDFCPEYLLIATWDDVGYYDERNDKVGYLADNIPSLDMYIICFLTVEHISVCYCY